MRKLIFLILITLFAAYAGWAERRPVGHYLSDLRSQVSVVQGQPGERGNLLAVQPELFTPDYQSAERLQLKFHAYLENARRQGLLNERTVVVFPEHVGTWLVASGEKPEVYAAADWPTAMDWMAASNPLKVARGWITARGEQRLTDTLFRMKAVDMAHDYQTLFGGLAHDFKVTVVAGSIVLPDPEVEDGELRPGTGQLYNVSLTFGPDGRPLGQPQRKVFPTRHELSYLNNGRGERLQVLDTPAGRLGVLIGTDSWYPDTYATLVEQRVELLAIPAALNQSGRWQQPWPGFDAELVPGDVRLAPNSLSNAEAWQRLAVGERLLASGARGGAVAFAHSRLWNVTEDGQSLLEQYGLDQRRLAEPGARLSIPRYMRLGHAAIQLSGDPALGLQMGRLSRLGQMGLAGVSVAQAPNLRAAARAMIHLEPLYAQNYRGQSSLVEDAGGAWLRFYSISPYNAYNRFVVDSVLAGWISHLGALARQPLKAERVEIEYPAPPWAERYEAFFGCPVEFGAPTNQLRLSQASLALANAEHCPSTWNQMLELCNRELEQLTRTRSWRERISRLLGPMLNGREPDLEEVAARLKLPTWTLRRKLAEEGTQFRSILNDTRRDLAMVYIRETDLAFGEIAYLLGFASAEAFQRAFKRWSGQTPGEFRRAQRQSA
ncbi:TPA: helix-turn-helix domain-containing protein [Pseudomonas aeruginosa]|nr:helix-turn-helix domain-containing protein [Pseudomonas aeruginosa]